MPLVHIDLMHGRSEQQLAAMIRGVSDAIAVALDAPLESIRVVINEMQPHQYGVGGDPWPVVVEARRRAAADLAGSSGGEAADRAPTGSGEAADPGTAATSDPDRT